MVYLGSRMICLGTNTNSEKSTLGSRVSFGARIESNSKNWNSHSFSIKGMWLSKIGYSISRSMDMRINVGSRNWSKLGKNTGVNIDSKMETESQSWGSGSHSWLSSISLKWKLANSSMGWYWLSSRFCDEIESWSKSSRYHDSWCSSIWLEVSRIVKD